MTTFLYIKQRESSEMNPIKSGAAWASAIILLALGNYAGFIADSAADVLFPVFAAMGAMQTALSCRPRREAC